MVILDSADNDPVRYWNHFIAAMGNIAPDHFQRSRAWLQSGSLEISETLMVLLLNELDMLKNPVLLILDDFHLIKSEEIHRSLIYLLRYLPDNVHILLLTRDAVPFPLERLKSDRELHEIRREQLCFKQEEIRQLFSIMGAGLLSEPELRELNLLSEGWVGLLCVMAARTLHTPRLNFLDSIHPNQLNVFDYLNEELFMELDSDMKSFMLSTSIVDRMCPELCHALTGRKDAQALLARLEHSNTFVTIVESSESCFRYHQLFREFLQERLKKQAPQKVLILHEKASKWFASVELMDEAIEHSLACTRWDMATVWIKNTCPHPYTQQTYPHA